MSSCFKIFVGTLNDLFFVAELGLQFECLPNGDPIPGVPRVRYLSYPEWSSPARPNPPRSPSRSSPSADSSFRAGFRSSPAICSSFRLGEITFKDISSVRLIPLANPNRRFKICRYTFSRDTPIQVKEKPNVFRPLPTGRQIVLSTSNSDVLAIVELNNTVLSGIYTTRRRRAKINMKCGEIKMMTKEEIMESPVGNRRFIATNFNIIRIDGFRRQH